MWLSESNFILIEAGADVCEESYSACGMAGKNEEGDGEGKSLWSSLGQEENRTEFPLEFLSYCQ